MWDRAWSGCGTGFTSLSRDSSDRSGAQLRRELQSSDLTAVYLIGTIREPQGSSVCVGVREWKIVTDTATAVRLDGPIDHPTGHVGRRYLDHRYFESRRF